MPDDDRQRAYCATMRRRAVMQGTTAIVIAVWLATCAAPLVRNEARRSQDSYQDVAFPS